MLIHKIINVSDLDYTIIQILLKIFQSDCRNFSLLSMFLFLETWSLLDFQNNKLTIILFNPVYILFSLKRLINTATGHHIK